MGKSFTFRLCLSLIACGILSCASTAGPAAEDGDRQSPARFKTALTPMEGAEEIIDDLRRLGLEAGLYQDPVEEKNPANPRDYEAIWIGCRVSPAVAVKVIMTARRRWPFLKYVELSCDGDVPPPEGIHDEIYLGGATDTARMNGLKPWSDDDFRGLLPGDSMKEFHRRIRSRYGKK